MISPALMTVMYVSRARISLPQVDSMVSRSRVKNAQRGITGGLIFTGQHFAQVLEGPTPVVLGLMEAICDDQRHDTVKPVLREELLARRFSMWTMGYVVLPHGDQLVLPLLTAPLGCDQAHELRNVLLTTIGREQGIKVQV